MKANDQFVLAPHCDGCGVVPLLAGHTCSKKGVREICPICGKDLLIMEKGGKIIYRAADRCYCTESCPCCRSCCQALKNAACA